MPSQRLVWLFAATMTALTACGRLHADPPPDISALIDKLTEVSDQDVGYSASASGEAFLPLDTEGQVQVMLLGQKPPAPSSTMRKLVQQGVTALPHLIAHLNDKRHTSIRVKHPDTGVLVIGGLRFSEYLDCNRRTDKPSAGEGEDGPVERDTHSYTVTVGDLCFVAVGQIVNRDYAALRYQATAITVVTSPTRSPAVREQVKRAWGSLTREQHRASLVADFLKPDHTGRRVGACKRLAYYYPDALPPLALPFLAEPTSAGQDKDCSPGAALSDAEKGRVIEAGLVYDHSEKIDRAVHQLLKSTKNDYMAEACIKRLVGRGYDADIEAYCRPRLKRATTEPEREYYQKIFDQLGWTPLHVAASRGDSDGLSALLRGAAKVNTAARDGKTPLHVAAEAGHPECVMVLLDYQADIAAKDRRGRTPLDLARQAEQAEVIKLLEQHQPHH